MPDVELPSHPSTESNKLVTPTTSSFPTSIPPSTVSVGPLFESIAAFDDPSTPSFDRARWDKYMTSWLGRLDSDDIATMMTDQLPAVMRPLIKTPSPIINEEPFFGLRTQLPLRTHVSVSGATTYEDVKLCRVLQWLDMRTTGKGEFASTIFTFHFVSSADK